MLNKCSHFTMIVISGLVWSVIGVMLMSVGMHHMMDALRFWDELKASSGFSLFKLFSFVDKPDQAMLCVIGICLMVGYLKGHYVLSKTVKAGVQKITSYPNPTELKNLYSKKYYLIIGSMMLLGFILRVSKIPPDIHGAIDVAIGAALLKGALHYFKYALAEKRGTLA